MTEEELQALESFAKPESWGQFPVGEALAVACAEIRRLQAENECLQTQNAKLTAHLNKRISGGYVNV